MLLISTRTLPAGKRARFYPMRDELVIDPSVPFEHWHRYVERALDSPLRRRRHLRVIDGGAQAS